MADTSTSRRVRLRNGPPSSQIGSAVDRSSEAGPSQPRASRASTGRRKSGRASTQHADNDDERVSSKGTPSKGKRKPTEALQESLQGNAINNVATEATGKPEEDAEAKRQREEKERELYERWAEEYFEIVDQLPLELHRTFALMRELEDKVHNRLDLVASQALAYRDARMALKGQVQVNGEQRQAQEHALDDSLVPLRKERNLTPQDWQLPGPSSDADAEGEIEEEMLDADASIAQDAQVKHIEPAAKATGAAQAPAEGMATRAARLAILGGVAKASSEAIRAADEKVGLAVTAYEWVDRHIRRLDADLQKSESSLLLGLRAGTEASRGLQDALGLTQPGEGKQNDTRKSAADALPDEEGMSGFVGDMAIDPNEPKYCYCDQVSFGDMIACDNEDCPREWYHLECVGLTQPPKGKWYCLFCAPPGYKGSGTFPPHAPCLPPNLKGSHAAGSGRGRMAKRDGEEPPPRANGHAVASKDKRSKTAANMQSRARSRTSASGSTSVRVPKRKG